MNNAYMIRNDNKAIPVNVHLYGSFEDVEETLYAAEWLYDNTKSNKTKELVMSFIASWIYSIRPDTVEDTMFGNIKEEIENRPYKFLSSDFCFKHINELLHADVLDDIDALNKMVTEELNQEFLRARYGGMYDTARGSRDMYFRISSTNFNWFNIIWEFVYEHKNQIDTVTICADEEATGKSEYYYKHNGQFINKMSVDDFLTLSGNPVFESFNPKGTLHLGLIRGHSIIESLPRANIRRVYERYTGIRERHMPYSYIISINKE